MARPKMILRPDVRHLILAALREGASRRDAALVAGVSPRTLQEWASRGRGTDDRPTSPMHRQFLHEMEQAEAVGRIQLVTLLRAWGKRDWRAAAHLLACRDPENWSRTHRVEGRVEVIETTAVDREIERLTRELEDRVRAEAAASVASAPDDAADDADT